jgi:hypothetical protein
VTGALDLHQHLKPKSKVDVQEWKIILKIPGTKRSSQIPDLEKIHELREARLGLLREHRLPLDGLDFADGVGAVAFRGEAADVVEDVD